MPSPPTSAPPTTWEDALVVLAITVPVALLFHFICAQSMFRTAQAGTGFSLAAYRRLFWSWPSLLLSWAPLLVGALGNLGCALWRDAGHLIFPWAMLGVSALFGLAIFVCQLLRQRLIRRNFPLAPTAGTVPPPGR